jgi:hypothetical protein
MLTRKSMQKEEGARRFRAWSGLKSKRPKRRSANRTNRTYGTYGTNGTATHMPCEFLPLDLSLQIE